MRMLALCFLWMAVAAATAQDKSKPPTQGDVAQQSPAKSAEAAKEDAIAVIPDGLRADYFKAGVLQLQIQQEAQAVQAQIGAVVAKMQGVCAAKNQDLQFNSPDHEPRCALKSQVTSEKEKAAKPLPRK